MNRRTIVKTLAVVLPVLGVAACSGTTKKSESLTKVDDLIARVERVQVEAAVCKDTARTALDKLHTLVSPDFDGDASATYAELLAAIDQSEAQAKKLHSAVMPMSKVADKIFEQWTVDMQSIGNSRMRQRSQARLEETRARYQAILTSATSAQLVYDAFNADLLDHALFLGHDFNVVAVSMIAEEVRGLSDRSHELDARLDACAAAARAYVESSALHGQVGAPDEVQVDETPPPPTAKKRRTTLSTGPKKGAPETEEPVTFESPKRTDQGPPPPPQRGN